MKQDFELLRRLEEISEKEADKIKYMYADHLIGFCSQIFDICIPRDKRENPIPEEWFDAVIDGVINSFFGGCEPEFETEEQWERYEKGIEKLKTCEWTVPIETTDCWGYKHYKPTSPYQDKTIPFLHPKQ